MKLKEVIEEVRAFELSFRFFSCEVSIKHINQISYVVVVEFTKKETFFRSAHRAISFNDFELAIERFRQAMKAKTGKETPFYFKNELSGKINFCLQGVEI